jgi:5'-3' exonuclease
MTTLVIDDKEAEFIIAQYGEKTIIEYIKTFSPTLHKYVEKDDLDSKLRVLKPVNKERGEKLRKAFSSLNSKLANSQYIDVKKEKELSLDTRLKSLKVVNPDEGKRLEEALEFLKENCNK